jgi:hypothetical protein
MTADPLALEAIEELALTARPLLVVDVDEVICHFVQPLIAHLERRGYWLDLVSYGLTGNIKHAGTHNAANRETVVALIQGFFDEEIATQPMVDHAAPVLARLAELAEIVILTNAPHRHRETRRTALQNQGIRWPLLTNDGPKGPVVAALSARAGAPVVFIDDSPNNLTSVRDHAPETVLIQFVADQRFLALSRDIPGVALKTGDWLAVEQFLLKTLDRAAGGGSGP